MKEEKHWDWKKKRIFDDLENQKRSKEKAMEENKKKLKMIINKEQKNCYYG